MNILQNEKAFILIEQVVIISIIGLLALSAIFAFSNVTLKQKQRAAVQELYFNLRRIQNYSITGRLVQNKLPKNYGLYLDKNRYILFLDMNGSKTFDPSVDDIIEVVKIDPILKITPSTGAFVSQIPNGSFCFNEKNIIGKQNCKGTTKIEISILGLNIVKSIKVYHELGFISYE